MAVKKKEFRYFSIEVYENYIRTLRNDDEREYGPVLSGIALTNEPAVHDIPGIFSKINNLSIDKDNAAIQSNDEGDQNMKSIFALLGVEDEASAIKSINTLNNDLASSKQEFDKALKAKDEKITALETDLKTQKENFEKEKEKLFTSEKETFLNGLFDNNVITKDKLDKALKYSREQFDVFKDVYAVNKDDKQTVLPQPKGVGSSNNKEPGAFSDYFTNDDKNKGKVVSLNKILG